MLKFISFLIVFALTFASFQANANEVTVPINDKNKSEKVLSIFVSTDFVYLDHPKMSGATGFNGAPQTTFTMNGNELDLSQSYWENRNKIGVSYEFLDNMPVGIFYTRSDGRFNNSNTILLGTNEWMNNYSLTTGLRLGTIGAQNQTVISNLDFEENRNQFGLTIKFTKGQSYLGGSYSYTEANAQSNFSQTSETYTHNLNEDLETKIHRVSLLMGHTFQTFMEDLSLSIEGDFGYAIARDHYTANHYGSPQFLPAFQENFSTSNNRAHPSFELSIKPRYELGSWTIAPYGIVMWRETPTIKYSKPAVLTSINTSPNQSAVLDHENSLNWGLGLQIEFKW